MDALMTSPALTEDAQFPWLRFRLKGQSYAINSRSIVSISTLPENVSPMPNAPDYMQGYFYLRDRIVPLYDLRTLFGLCTLKDEYLDFTNMLEQRKQDHLYWTSELKRSVAESRPFPLTTDPHQCAFGKWYDSFTSDSDTVNHHLRKIDEPHKHLHHAADDVMRCTQEHEQCKRSECLKHVLGRVEEEYIPKIVGLLDEAKKVFQSSYREMVVVIEREETLLGLMVDEVLSVESITPEQRSALPSVGQTSGAEGYTQGVAQSDDGEQVLLIDQDPLFALS